MHSFARIAVIGLGYIGLPTAAVFAENGVEVVGVDVNPRVVASINQGQPHFGEPNLDALVRRVVEGGKLRATTAVEPADAFIIAVPTPLRGHGADPQPDVSYVEAGGARDRAGAGGRQPGGPGIDLAGRHHRADGGDPRRAAA